MKEPRHQDLKTAAKEAHTLWKLAARARSEFTAEAFARAFEAIEDVFEEAGLDLEVTESGLTWKPRQEIPA